MSNVTNANFLHGFASDDDLKRLDRAELPHLVQHVRSVIESGRSKNDLPTARSSKLVELSIALHRSFDMREDRLVWDIPGLEPSGPAERRRLRFDVEHDAGSSLDGSDRHWQQTQLMAAIGRAFAGAKLGRRQWVVGVVLSTSSYPQSLVQRLQALCEQNASLLLVICDLEATIENGTADSQSEPDSWRRLAMDSGVDEVGPLPGGDVAQLVDTLDRIKQSGGPAILHVRIPQSRRAAIAPVAPRTISAKQRLAALPYFEAAAMHLAERAVHDPRILAVSLGCDRQSLANWPAQLTTQWVDIRYDAPHALAWCTGSADGGCRPFVFLSRPAFHQHFGALREEVCLKSAPVTLLLDAARLESSAASGAADLAALQLMPGLAVLAPKDCHELAQMIDWSLGQSKPAVILLPNRAEAESLWESSAPVTRGHAELVMPGEDVALVAFGAMVGPATVAARRLAAEGISAAVINARFVAPMDRERMLEWLRQSMSVVIIEEHGQGGGFSSRILELLAETGAASAVSVLAPYAGLRRVKPDHRYEQCVRAIVERCRWLSEPTVPSVPNGSFNGSAEAAGPAANAWLDLVVPELARSYDLHEQVLAQQPSPSVHAWMQTYLKVGRRELYFWQWCVLGAELTTMPCVLPALRADVCDTKVLSIMLCVLLDDVADLLAKKKLLEALLAIIGGHKAPNLAELSAEDRNYVAVTEELSKIYQQRIRQYPGYAKYENLLDYDLMQYFNTMRYSHLLNHQLTLLNVTEHDLYMPHAMHMMSFATLDLMCTPDFDEAELGKMREVIWHAQCMGRIGNLLGTWRREIGEKDFNSGVFARAVTAGDLTMADLAKADQELIENAVVDGRHEDHFLARWHFHRQHCLDKAAQIHSVNLAGFMAGQERFFQMHLDCRGRI